LSLIQGVIDAFDLPVRQAMVVEFVERKEHLSNAIALNSSLFNLARLIGPAIADSSSLGVGAGFCFLIDGLSYLAVIAALLLMRLRKRAVRKVKERPWVEFRQGFHYAVRLSRQFRALILLIAAVSATGFSCSVLMPMFARDRLSWRCSHPRLAHVGDRAVGAVTGALYLGGRKTVRGLGLVITIGGSVYGHRL
jgi:MFS family permease